MVYNNNNMVIETFSMQSVFSTCKKLRILPNTSPAMHRPNATQVWVLLLLTTWQRRRRALHQTHDRSCVAHTRRSIRRSGSSAGATQFAISGGGDVVVVYSAAAAAAAATAAAAAAALSQSCSRRCSSGGAVTLRRSLLLLLLLLLQLRDEPGGECTKYFDISWYQTIYNIYLTLICNI